MDVLRKKKNVPRTSVHERGTEDKVPIACIIRDTVLYNVVIEVETTAETSKSRRRKPEDSGER